MLRAHRSLAARSAGALRGADRAPLRHGGRCHRDDRLRSGPLGRLLLQGADLREGLRSRSRRRRSTSTCEGVFGLRMRAARLRLGDEFIELTEYPGAARAARARRRAQQRSLVPAHRDHRQRHGPRLRSGCARTRCSTRRPGRSGCPTGTRTPAASRPSISAIPTVTPLEILAFPPDKGDPKWHAADGQAVSRNRSHRDRRRRHRGEPALLSRRARPAGRRRERELRRRAGAPEQRVRRAPAHHGVAGRGRARASSFSNTWRRATAARIRRRRRPTTSSTGKPGSWGPAWTKPRRISGKSGPPSFRPESSNCRTRRRGSGNQSSFAIRTAMPSRSCEQ